MADVNPEWVEAGARAYLRTLYVDDGAPIRDWDRTIAAAVIAAVEPLIRADEWERREEFWEARWREAVEQREQAWADLARAEAVAARLVEVICEQEADLRILQEWHVQHGMVCEVAKRPGGHIWRNAPGRKQCWCSHRQDHDESPLILWQQKENSLRSQIAADILRAGRDNIPEYRHAARIARGES